MEMSKEMVQRMGLGLKKTWLRRAALRTEMVKTRMIKVISRVER